MISWDAFFAWVGRAAAFSAPIGLVLIWLGRTYIDRWLARRFQAQLDAIKHVQAVDFAKQKLAFDAKLHRATKLHEREFEILPRAWEMLGSARGSIGLLIDQGQTHTDVDKLDALALDEFLAPLPISASEKEAIATAPIGMRTDLFIERKLRFQMVDASSQAANFHNYIATHGVFIEPKLRKKLFTVSEVYESVVNTHSMLIVHGSSPRIDVSALNRQKFKALDKVIGQIGDEISERIWGASKLDC